MADPSFYMRYPGFRNKALTLSYDDGITPDLYLADILNRYGLKCTFNVNAGYFGHPMTRVPGRRLYAEELTTLMAGGHEIAAHGYKHKWLSSLPSPQALYEVLCDRRRLEGVTGAPVTGLAYAMGDYDERVISLLRKAGFAYARTVVSTRAFRTPTEPLAWHPTCHHADARLMELAESFVNNTKDNDRPLLFYLWGHSYEFVERDNWDVIERFADHMAGREELWYVTNGAFISYMNAYRSLRLSADGGTVYNPSAQDVYFFYHGYNRIAPAGKQIKL